MRISASSHYASRILVMLTRHADEAPIPAAALAERTGISIKFVEKIIRPLKKAGLVDSVRGATGGHMLAMRPEQVSLGDVVRAIEGGIDLTHCCDDPERCRSKESCSTRQMWSGVSRALERTLDAITLLDLLNDPAPECTNLPEPPKKRSHSSKESESKDDSEAGEGKLLSPRSHTKSRCCDPLLSASDSCSCSHGCPVS
ncbi:RrF2 family transcriptional regulator [Oleidesulfovibrio sp.]|uniref:RrF2 family transcriptional regulator n=1 Tax=Oleidesulfovibrio sp. TaxID=2909707 RepID=UPI003A8472FD